MNKRIKRYLEDYELVSSEIKFITNSLTRLSLLYALYERPHTMKDLNKKVKINYGAISNNTRILESDDFIYRDLNEYHLNNIMKLYLSNLKDLGKTLLILNDFFSFFNSHFVKNISINSIKELYLLEESQLIESNEKDAYKTYNHIQNILKNAKFIKGIFPYSYSNFPQLINELLNKDIKIQLLFPRKI